MTVNQRRRAQRQIAHWRRSGDASPARLERVGGVALEPVEIEAQGAERNEGGQNRRAATT